MDAHIVCAAKLVMFALVGLGWLSLREYLGALPVADMSALITVMTLAVLNLVAALVLPTTEEFKGPARAFLGAILALCVWYWCSLAQSLGSDSMTCGGGKATFQGTWAKAFYGGLPLHEAAGALTLAFLLIYLTLAAGQARACMKQPSEWIPPGTGQAILIPVGIQYAIFVFRAPVAEELAILMGLVIALAVVCFILMIRLDWLADIGVGRMGPLAQLIAEAAFTSLLILMTLCLAGFTSGAFPLLAFLISSAVLVGLGVAYRWEGLGEVEEDTLPSAPKALVSRMPGIRVQLGKKAR